MDSELELKELFLMQQVYSTLFSVYNKMQTESSKRFSTLSSRQYMTILAILHLPENERTMNNVAKKLGTTKQNIRQLITTLEKKQLIEIQSSNRDRRATNLEVTPAGMNEMLKAGEIGIMFLADLFNEFSSEELQLLWYLLKKMYRFDGKEHDGFEHDPNSDISIDKTVQEIQIKTLQTFVKKRKESRRNSDEQ
ncbi:MAG TPA: MarR family transcriptional regulator [Bacillota bacterium]|nr:MarR family transcriptional regulator [Bacillota bacterium]HOL08841.1 MarR family transcriptional regulator [Bacillota bacterium]HPO96534.1 MarR family transcriptional regulator [Bacillota bacterium]